MHMPSHDVYTIEVNPADANFDHVNRPRVYHILVHKVTAKMLCNPIDMYERVKKAVRQSFSGPRRPEIRDTFVATDEEVCAELKRVQCRVA